MDSSSSSRQPLPSPIPSPPAQSSFGPFPLSPFFRPPPPPLGGGSPPPMTEPWSLRSLVPPTLVWPPGLLFGDSLSSPDETREALLPPGSPTTTIMSGTTTARSSFDDEQDRPRHSSPYRDITWGLLYLLCLGSWLILSLTLLYKFSGMTTSKTGGVPRLISFVATLRDSAGLLASTTAVSLVLGLVWLTALFRSAKTLIRTTLVAIPISLIGLSLLTLILGLPAIDAHPGLFISPGSQRQTLWILSLCLLGLGLLVGTLLAKKKGRLDQTVNLIILSMGILERNKGLFVISGLLTLGQVVFTLIWGLLSLSTLSLWSSSSSLPLPGQSLSAVPLPSSSLLSGLVVYSIFIFFWTSSLFQSLERLVIANVVGEYYFYQVSSPWRSLKTSLSTSFGSAAFASLILGAISTLQWIMARVTRNAPRMLRVPLSCLLAPFSFALWFIQEWTPFTLIRVGIAGEDLLTATREVTGLFRRNLVLGLLSSSLSRLVILSGSLTLSALCGLIVGAIATWSLSSPHGILLGTLATLIPFYLLRFIGNILLSTMDSTFICYLMDLDGNTCHLPAAHRLYSVATL